MDNAAKISWQAYEDRGKGQPKKKASMESMETVSAILAASGRAMAFEKSSLPASASKATQAEIIATIHPQKADPFFGNDSHSCCQACKA